MYFLIIRKLSLIFTKTKKKNLLSKKTYKLCVSVEDVLVEFFPRIWSLFLKNCSFLVIFLTYCIDFLGGQLSGFAPCVRLLHQFVVSKFYFTINSQIPCYSLQLTECLRNCAVITLSEYGFRFRGFITCSVLCDVSIANACLKQFFCYRNTNYQ